MKTDLMEEWMEARRNRRSCALVTVAATSGSVPREPGAKMIVFADGSIQGTIGGGRFEALVVEEAVRTLPQGKPVLRTYPLHEGRDDSFGAICGGEATILIEPPPTHGRLVLLGAGHCARAIARFASGCGLEITVVDDRTDLTTETAFPEADHRVTGRPIKDYLDEQNWTSRDAVVLVNRSYDLDREALGLLLPRSETLGYLGMIGSRRKVRRVFEELKQAGTPVRPEHRVFAPIGLDIGADSPEEIAISVLAEILRVQRGASGRHLSIQPD